MKLHIEVSTRISMLPDATRDMTESLTMSLCEQRNAQTLLEQFGCLRMAIIMDLELALENIRLSESDNVRLAAAEHVFHKLDYVGQALTSEIKSEITTKALRYFKDPEHRVATQKRLAAAGIPKDAVDREIARRSLEISAPLEQLSASIGRRHYSTLRSLGEAHKLRRL